MKKKTIIITAIIGAVALCAAVYAATTAGTASDPIVSLSYAEKYADSLLNDSSYSLQNVYDGSFFDLSQAVGKSNAARQIGSVVSSDGVTALGFKKGDILLGTVGTTFTLKSGTFKAQGSSLIEIKGSKNITAGSALTAGLSYMSAASGSGITIASDTARVYIEGTCTPTYSGSTDFNSLADALNGMGLFNGDGTGYALERSATRVEGLVMFIRLLGEEQDALSYTGTHPFTDVDSWASRYVAYAYSKGYTKGVSSTQFGSKNTLTPAQYMTFVLRALSYTEGTDFKWSTSIADAASMGLLNSGEKTLLGGSFLRAQVVYLSYYSLFMQNKTTGTPLLNVLLKDGAVDNSSVTLGISKIIGLRVN